MTFHPAMPHISCLALVLLLCPSVPLFVSLHLSCPNLRGSNTWGERNGQTGWAEWYSKCCSYQLWCWDICDCLGLQPTLFAKRGLGTLWRHPEVSHIPTAAGFASQLLWERAGWGSGQGTALPCVWQDWGHCGPSVNKQSDISLVWNKLPLFQREILSPSRLSVEDVPALQYIREQEDGAHTVFPACRGKVSKLSPLEGGVPSYLPLAQLAEAGWG